MSFSRKVGDAQSFFLTPVNQGTRQSEHSQSVQFSDSVLSDSLRPHKRQHPRLPCPSPTPGAQAQVHHVSDATQPSHPLSPPSHAFNLSQHRGLFH